MKYNDYQSCGQTYNNLLITKTKEAEVFNKMFLLWLHLLSGKLPLHYAMKCNASCQLIICFVAAYPDSVGIADNYGNLPIHCAFIEGSKSFNLAKKLEILLRIYPDSASAENLDGLTPLALAERCRKRSQINSLDYNVEANVRDILNQSQKWTRQSQKKRNGALAHEDQYASYDNLKRPYTTEITTGFGKTRNISPEQISPEGLCTSEKKQKKTGDKKSNNFVRPRDVKLCTICREGTLSHCLVPCGHVALCARCAEPEELIHLRGCEFGKII